MYMKMPNDKFAHRTVQDNDGCLATFFYLIVAVAIVSLMVIAGIA